MMQRTTSYNLDVQTDLWRGYAALVPQEFRYEHRIQAVMAADVLDHRDEVDEATVEAAERVIEAYGDDLDMDVEVADGA